MTNSIKISISKNNIIKTFQKIIEPNKTQIKFFLENNLDNDNKFYILSEFLFKNSDKI